MLKRSKLKRLGSKVNQRISQNKAESVSAKSNCNKYKNASAIKPVNNSKE